MTTEPLPDWVGAFLNRRTAVENKLRAPLIEQRKGRPVKVPTPEELWELANELSIPAEFNPKPPPK